MTNPLMVQGRELPFALRVAEAAKEFSISKSTIRNAVRDGALKSHLVGRSRLLFTNDIISWITGRADQDLEA